MSLWLDDTEALVRRLQESEASQEGTRVHRLVSAIHEAQLAMAQFFAEKAAYTPKRYESKE